MHTTTSHQAGASVPADTVLRATGDMPEAHGREVGAAQKAQSPGPAGLHAEQTKTNTAAILAPCGSAVNPDGHAFDQGEFRDLRDRFAKRGYSLQRTFRADDGRIHYIIMRRSRTCVLSHPHDVRAYLTQVEGKPV